MPKLQTILRYGVQKLLLTPSLYYKTKLLGTIRELMPYEGSVISSQNMSDVQVTGLDQINYFYENIYSTVQSLIEQETLVISMSAITGESTKHLVYFTLANNAEAQYLAKLGYRFLSVLVDDATDRVYLSPLVAEIVEALPLITVTHIGRMRRHIYACSQEDVLLIDLIKTNSDSIRTTKLVTHRAIMNKLPGIRKHYEGLEISRD